MTVKMEDGRGVIRLGDKTDHGGEVVQVAHDVTDMGKPIACKGDMVKCPKCKGTFPIVEGESTWIIDGVPVAFHSHKTACGAKLISSWGISGGLVSAPASIIPGQEIHPAIKDSKEPTKAYDEKVKLTSNANTMSGLPVFIVLNNGKTVSGYAGNDGNLPRVETEGEGFYEVYWGDEALEKMESEE